MLSGSDNSAKFAIFTNQFSHSIYQIEMLEQTGKTHLSRFFCWIWIPAQKYHFMVCKGKTCCYSTDCVPISRTEFKFFSQHTFSLVYYLNNIHRFAICGTIIAGKHRNEKRRNSSHVNKANCVT